MKKSIFASFLTTVSLRQCRLAFRLLFQRWRWFDRDLVLDFEQSFVDYLFEGKKSLSDISIMSFYNARSALYHGLLALDIGKGDSVVVQGYTCVSVINAIKATGAKPVYVDITKDSLNIDIEKLVHVLEREKGRVKVVIVQHTLGMVADVAAIQEVCSEYNIALLEDCAHALGALYNDQRVGTFGDVAIFSFGRDKIVSSVNGGVLLINNDRYFSYLSYIKPLDVSSFWVFKNLLYVIVGYCSYRTYDILKIGKIMYYLAGKLGWFPVIVSDKEKKCRFDDLSFALPGVLAFLAKKEVAMIDHYNNHRRHLALFYKEKLGKNIIYPDQEHGVRHDVFLRLVYLVDDPSGVSQKLKTKKIYVGDRYQQVIAPNDIDQSIVGYKQGMCPVAENIASKTVNLPNSRFVDESDAGFVVASLEKL